MLGSGFDIRTALESKARVCPGRREFKIRCHALMVVHLIQEAFQTARCDRDQKSDSVIAYRLYRNSTFSAAK